MEKVSILRFNPKCPAKNVRSTVVAFALLDPAAPHSNPGILEFFQRVDVAEVNRQHCCLELWTAEA